MIQMVIDKRLKRSELMQIVDQLKHYHVQSAMNDGDLFPDYQAVAVANHMDASMVQLAYDQMVDDGYFTKVKTRYYVKRLPFVERYDGQFKTFYGAVEALGMTPSFKTFKVEIIEQLPALFNVEETLQNRRYVRLEKVYYADQIPLIHAAQFYQLALFPDFTELDFNAMRIFPYLEKMHGIRFSHYREIIDVVHPIESINEALNQPLDASVFRMLMQASDEHHTPFEFSILHTSILYSLESINRLR